MYIQIGFRCSKELDLATLKKAKQLFPWENTVKALHTIVSSLSKSEKEMNILDLCQLGQCSVDLFIGWLSISAMKIKFGRVFCKDRFWAFLKACCLFRLGIRKGFFHQRVIGRWNRLPSEQHRGCMQSSFS